MDTDEYVLRRIVSGVENEEVLRRMIERKVLEQEERRKRAVMVKNRILKVLKIHSWVPVIGSYLGYRALIWKKRGFHSMTYVPFSSFPSSEECLH